MKTLVIEGENGPVIKEHDGVDLSRMNQAARVELIHLYYQENGSVKARPRSLTPRSN